MVIRNSNKLWLITAVVNKLWLINAMMRYDLTSEPQTLEA